MLFLPISTYFYGVSPDWEASLGGFPALSVVPGQFLMKDVVLSTSGKMNPETWN